MQAASQGLRTFSSTPTENPMQVALDQMSMEMDDFKKLTRLVNGAPTHLEDASEIFPKQHDIYEESFKNLLKDFCHNYQIPFLENNLPKSCRQAAKIYYCLREDDKDQSIPE
jgi:hypothetical protein